MKGVGKTSILEQAIYGNLTEKTVLQFFVNILCRRSIFSISRRYTLLSRIFMLPILNLTEALKKK